MRAALREWLREPPSREFVIFSFAGMGVAAVLIFTWVLGN